MTTMFNHDVIDFEVEKVPLYQYESIGDHFPQVGSDVGSLLRRKDNKKPFAVVKDRYEVMQYKTTVQDIETAIANSGMDLTESGQIIPEQSTAAIVVHHPDAEYFVL